MVNKRLDCNLKKENMSLTQTKQKRKKTKKEQMNLVWKSIACTVLWTVVLLVQFASYLFWVQLYGKYRVDPLLIVVPLVVFWYPVHRHYKTWIDTNTRYMDVNPFYFYPHSVQVHPLRLTVVKILDLSVGYTFNRVLCLVRLWKAVRANPELAKTLNVQGKDQPESECLRILQSINNSMLFASFWSELYMFLALPALDNRNTENWSPIGYETHVLVLWAIHVGLLLFLLFATPFSKGRKAHAAAAQSFCSLSFAPFLSRSFFVIFFFVEFLEADSVTRSVSEPTDSNGYFVKETKNGKSKPIQHWLDFQLLLKQEKWNPLLQTLFDDWICFPSTWQETWNVYSWSCRRTWQQRWWNFVTVHSSTTPSQWDWLCSFWVWFPCYQALFYLFFGTFCFHGVRGFSLLLHVVSILCICVCLLPWFHPLGLQKLFSKSRVVSQFLKETNPSDYTPDYWKGYICLKHPSDHAFLNQIDTLQQHGPLKIYADLASLYFAPRELPDVLPRECLNLVWRYAVDPLKQFDSSYASCLLSLLRRTEDPRAF